MSGLFRKLIPLALVIATAMTIPTTATAAPCTAGYMRCLNSSYDMKGFAEYLANLECGISFAACLKAILI